MMPRLGNSGINDLIALLNRAWPAHEPHLIQLPIDQTIAFIGDIHGDGDAVDQVFKRCPPTEYVLVFMGDVVDRGPDSAYVLSQIAQAKLRTPHRVHLLMGNHEAHSVSTFRPAEFWETLRIDQAERLSHHLEKLPWAAWHSAGILATHGGIPDIASLEDIKNLSLGDQGWRDITWGDWVDDDSTQTKHGPKRPSYGPTIFKQRTSRLGIRVHIRSHQPTIALHSFGDRCLTLFTTSAYGDGKRRIALWWPSRALDSARDLELIEI